MNSPGKVSLFISLNLFLMFYGTPLLSQGTAATDIDKLMEGAIDFHVHSAPDVNAGSMNDFEVAELASKRHFKAIVIKSHVSCTAGRVVLVNLKVENIKVFGGITLNKAVGGINPDAVEVMCKMSPQYGKVVWFPTMDAAFVKQKVGEGLTVLKDGKLNAETIQVLKIIARENLVLATGHLSPKEILLLVPAAKRIGVNNILITHAMSSAPGLSIAQMTEVAKSGAIIELAYVNVLPGTTNSGTKKQLTINDMVMAIKQIGAAHFIISSDLGQAGNPLPPHGLQQFVSTFMQKGISADDIKLMIKTTPAKLLGIDN
jgi:hypothetical protein